MKNRQNKRLVEEIMTEISYYCIPKCIYNNNNFSFVFSFLQFCREASYDKKFKMFCSKFHF